MSEKHKREEKPWRPNVERESEINPFVNPLDRTGALENPPPLADEEDEENEEEQSLAPEGVDPAAEVVASIARRIAPRVAPHRAT
jgi:hypothetical protein